jgi:hypothetical protein
MAPPVLRSLTPTTIEPYRQSGNAMPLAMLSQIETVQVKRTVEHGHTTYFVMDVYLRHIDSRLPIASSMLSRLRRRTTQTSRAPDYQIGARFSDFASLRSEISDLLCMNARFTCEYCNTFNEFIKFRVAQPRWIVKIGTRTELRKSILESFINDFLAMTLHRCQADSKCQVRAQAPAIMAKFLRQRYPEGQEPVATSLPEEARDENNSGRH